MGSCWKRERHEATNERERGSRRSDAREIDLTERAEGTESAYTGTARHSHNTTTVVVETCLLRREIPYQFEIPEITYVLLHDF